MSAKLATVKVQLDQAPDHVLNWLMASIVFPKDTYIKDPTGFTQDDYPFTTEWRDTGPLIGRRGIMFKPDEHGLSAYFWSTPSGPFKVAKDHLRAAVKLMIHYELGPEPDVPVVVLHAK